MLSTPVKGCENMENFLKKKSSGTVRVLKQLAFHVLLTAGIGLFVFALDYFEIGCPIRFFLGIPCPTCGVTRALLSLAHLDFAGYLYYNPMAVPLCAVLLLALHQKVLPFGRKWITGVIIGVAAVSFAVYLIRLF